MLDPRTHHPMNSFQLYDGTRHKTQNYHDTWEATNSGLWPSRQAQFGTEPNEVDESGIYTHGNQYRINHNRSLSPDSRTQAIARGQRELMEMVRNMPESSYELSLKDLVEHHRVNPRQEDTVEERNLNVYKREGSGRKVVKMAKVVKKSGNIDRGGFYLKMVLPFSLGSKQKKKNKKKNEAVGSSSSKVSPKPSASDGSGKGVVVDKEWWKKSPSACKESDSGESSINSGSVKSSGSSSSNSSCSRSNSRHDKSGGRCWNFIRRPKSRTQK
ncbi:uncharacterized protein LOC133315686 [Gastrolobium bilobum]|uniref:uncharacterized protein LOC133315686 n=1 Tax=Gastrolobium bilobum TaxID=150636 RepID=UPI002AB0D166|nr:uncharacterized protein LOC133315686 [Gastrolobium bilobum]